MKVDTTNYIITVGAGVLNRAWITEVMFCIDGNTATVTTQTSSSRTGAKGWSIIPLSGPSDGDYTLYAYIRPVNGYERRISLPITLNTNGTINPNTYYVATTGTDPAGCAGTGSTQGTVGAPWRSVLKATLCAPSGSKIEMAAGTYNEDSNAGTLNTIARPQYFYRAPGTSFGDVVITRSSRALNSGGWAIRSTKTRFSGILFDTAKIVQIQPNTLNSLFTCENGALIDSNGVTGPPTGYANSPDIAQLLLRETEGQFSALLECPVTNYVATGARLYRNSPLTVSADAIFYSSALAANNSASFFSPATQTLEMRTRLCVPTSLTVASVGTYLASFSATVSGAANNGSGLVRLTVDSTSGLTTGNSIRVSGIAGTTEANNGWIATVVDATHIDLQGSAFTNAYTLGGSVAAGVTTVRWSGSPAITNLSVAPPTHYLSFLTGPLAGQNFTMYAQSSVSFTTTVTGNATAALAGNTAWPNSMFHADSLQYGDATTNIENVYFQRYKAVGTKFQPIFSQMNTAAGSGTITAVGTAVTFSNAQTLKAGNFLSITNGAQQYQYAQVAADTTASTSATLVAAFTSDPTGRTFNISKTAKDFLCVACIFDHTDTSSEISQIQQGNEHFGLIQSVHIGNSNGTGTQMYLRSGSAGFGISNFGTFDSVLYGMSSDVTPGFPTVGNITDNNQFADGTGRGTNSSTGVVTFDANYKPTGGLTKQVRGMQGGILANGTPLFPWTYDGTAITSGALIGAQQP